MEQTMLQNRFAEKLCLDVFSVDVIICCSHAVPEKMFRRLQKGARSSPGKWDRYTVDISHFQTDHSIPHKLIDDWVWGLDVNLRLAFYKEPFF